MALHLNLNYEIENAKRARQRDPLKLALRGLVVIAACFAAYYFYRLAKVNAIAQELASRTADFNAVEAKAKLAKAREDQLSATIRTRDALLQQIESRFYWAPLLEDLTRIVPREVQADAVKKCKLSIDGVSAGADPRKVAEDLRTAIADALGKKYKNVSSTFRSLEDGIEMVQLEGKVWPTATFGINVEFQEGAELAAAPLYKGKTR